MVHEHRDGLVPARGDAADIKRLKLTGKLLTADVDIRQKSADEMGQNTTWDSCNRHREALRQFGLAFGTAYQVYDDCVDLFGSETVAGKSLGKDLAKGKLTLPVLLLWERASLPDRARLEHLVQNCRNGALTEIGALLSKYETLAPSVETIRQYLERARQMVQMMAETPGRVYLLGLTDYLARRRPQGISPQCGRLARASGWRRTHATAASQHR